MNVMNMNSRTDAQTFVDNSGVNWEWSGNASSNGFAEWLYQNRDNVDRDDYEAELAEYLTSVGENPSDYL